jgi:hypothetical protein
MAKTSEDVEKLLNMAQIPGEANRRQALPASRLRAHEGYELRVSLRLHRDLREDCLRLTAQNSLAAGCENSRST